MATEEKVKGYYNSKYTAEDIDRFISNIKDAKEAADTAKEAAEKAENAARSIPSDYSELAGQVKSNTDDIGVLNGRIDDVDEKVAVLDGRADSLDTGKANKEELAVLKEEIESGNVWTVDADGALTLRCEE